MTTTTTAASKKARQFKLWRSILGFTQWSVPWWERLLASIGGFLAIICVYYATKAMMPVDTSILITLSLGASAVLIFTVPHAPVAQPWPLFGGQLTSAVAGALCAQLLKLDLGIDPIWIGALAVGTAIAGMHWLRCIHPPGGATALYAVMGGDAVHELGMLYAVSPILINVSILLAFAVVFNYPFPWRRYPSRIAPHKSTTAAAQISHEELVMALSELETFMDISEEDLMNIYQIATRNAHTTTRLHTHEIQLGRCYQSFQDKQQVRKVTRMLEDDNGSTRIGYSVIQGEGKGRHGETGLADFSHWASQEVKLVDGKWEPVKEKIE